MSAAGDALTEDHRLAQVNVGAQFTAMSVLLLDEIRDLDADLEAWLALQITAAELAFGDSRDLARQYLVAHRVAERGESGYDMPVVDGDPFDAADVLERAAWLGPMAKKRIGEGEEPRDAIMSAGGALLGSILTRVYAGGRNLIDASVLANPHSRGYIRVTDGSACKWCNGLAGKVYRTNRELVMARKWHDACGCTLQEVFDSAGGRRAGASGPTAGR